MSSLGAILLTLGIVFLLVSWILLVITASKEDFSWTLCSVFLPPVGYLYGMFVWPKAKDAILTAVIAWVLLFLAVIA